MHKILFVIEKLSHFLSNCDYQIEVRLHMLHL